MHNMLPARKAQVVNALLAVMLLNILGHCETSIYPGLRRKPMQQSLQQQYELPSDFLAQLMEENARRRLQQQFEQQLELINMQLNRQRQLLERERFRQRQQELQTLAETEDDYANNLNNQYDQYDNVEFNYNRNSDINNNNNNNANTNINNNNNMNNRYTDMAYNNNNNNRELTNNINNNRNSILRERIPFAVGPSDARFFETDNEQSTEFDTQAMSDYEEYAPTEAKSEKVSAAQLQTKQQHHHQQQHHQQQQQQQQQQPLQQKQSLSGPVAALSPAPVLAPAPVESPKLLDGPAAANFHRIKPQTAAAAAVAGVNLVAVQAKENAAKGETPASASSKQHEISALIEKLQKQSKSSSLLDGTRAAIMGQEADQIVLRQHLGMDSEYGVYIVALIAGVSAAITVGLIALGITWLNNRSKATADVEYPAYGITGPNKEISPSGDRKLAHSAQMYHYQHQKQQIIAMENRQCAEGSCGISDVESDDDNEEGDYTVYECPGLAPTEEMEVKNPLFLDETPATPAGSLAATAASPSATVTNNLTQAQPQQPPAAKKGTVRSLTSLLTSSTDDKNNKKKNNNNK